VGVAAILFLLGFNERKSERGRKLHFLFYLFSSPFPLPSTDDGGGLVLRIEGFLPPFLLLSFSSYAFDAR